ncbi:glycoside hydrolase family 28 protein [Mucilaginibacter aquaedulcis]|uniref:glycoside hydrolase family 28 protein n=1 Tax=Mucilaginibacter aquaedulcis TaxID=1187081 RepID=UPI0025B3BA2C|nr:glycosyl hydrolase family 28 protein [Mucilaginibacter aquaedulcis]MDN3546944.1 glycosyl hydrolase family 28 protein [Mucilaginibacter aquaedulcis]
MKFLTWLVVFNLFVFAAFAQGKNYNIVSYGAKADGKTVDTKAIQKAIDDAAKKGGKVIIPAGKFVTGVIYLKSNVELHFEKNAFLLATTKRIDYGLGKASALIVANKANHISLTGYGTIDGQADLLLKDLYAVIKNGTIKDKEWQTYNDWHQMRPEEDNRPVLIHFTDCSDIAIKNITVTNGLDWIQNYTNCNRMVIDSIKVISNTFLNNDGIDLVDCKNVRLTNSFFNVADDGICLKSSDPKGACEKIFIANCKIRSSASAFKLGTASFGGFKDIKVRDIQVYDTYRSAIAIESVDGAVIENIDIRNVTAKNTGNALFIRLGKRQKNIPAGKLTGIYIANVNVQIPVTKPDAGYSMEGPPSLFAHNIFPASIAGIPGHPVQGVKLNNINITYGGGASKKVAYFPLDSLSAIPEKIADYPEFSMFGELPAWGFYVRHAGDISMQNIQIRYKAADFRSACVFDDVAGLQLNNFKVDKTETLPVMLFNKVTKRYLQKIQIPGKSEFAIKTQ